MAHPLIRNIWRQFAGIIALTGEAIFSGACFYDNKYLLTMKIIFI